MDCCGTRVPTRRSMTGLRRRSGEEQLQKKGKGSGDGTDAHAPAVRRTQKRHVFLYSLCSQKTVLILMVTNHHISLNKGLNTKLFTWENLGAFARASFAKRSARELNSREIKDRENKVNKERLKRNSSHSEVKV